MLIEECVTADVLQMIVRQICKYGKPDKCISLDHNTAAHLFGSAERKMHEKKIYYQNRITKMFQAILRFQYVIFDDAQIIVVQREFLESCQRRQIVLADLRYLCGAVCIAEKYEIKQNQKRNCYRKSLCVCSSFVALNGRAQLTITS